MGSAVRKLQRDRRPGRALSSRASPGRSRNASAASIGASAATAAGSRWMRDAVSRALTITEPMVAGSGRGGSRPARGMGRGARPGGKPGAPWPGYEVAATATGFSIGTLMRLPHSVHDPS